MGEDVIGGRDSSWQTMVSVRTSIVPPGPRLPPQDTPGASSAAMTPHVNASIHDFAVSLPEILTAVGGAGEQVSNAPDEPVVPCDRPERAAGQVLSRPRSAQPYLLARPPAVSPPSMT
jgi:hypothetical protein